MTYVKATTLTAALALAFSASAFANSPSPADEVIQTGTTAKTQTVVTIEPLIDIEPVVKTEAPDFQPNPLIQKTPLTVGREVAGEVITSETYVAPPPETAPAMELKDGSAELAANLDGFNQDNSQLDVNSAKNTITFGADR